MSEWVMTEPGVMSIDISDLVENDHLVSDKIKNPDITDTISTDADSGSSGSAQATAQNDKKPKTTS